MRPTRPSQTAGVLALCLACLPLVPMVWTWLPAPPRADVTSPGPPSPQTPFEVALREAWQRRTRVQVMVNREQEALAEWDPEATTGSSDEDLRRALLARHRSGGLRQAWRAARQAAALAGSPGEACRAAQLLARIECDLGRHDMELQQARRMMRWAPENVHSQDALRHALRCMQREALVEASHTPHTPAPGEPCLNRTGRAAPLSLDR